MTDPHMTDLVDQLKQQAADVPPPRADARRRAIDAGLQAFDAHPATADQGSAAGDRHTSRTARVLECLRRSRLMPGLVGFPWSWRVLAAGGGAAAVTFAVFYAQVLMTDGPVPVPSADDRAQRSIDVIAQAPNEPAREILEAPRSAPQSVVSPVPQPSQAYVEPPARSYQGAGRDRFEHFETGSVRLASRDPVSTFSIDVDTASYAFTRAALNEGDLPHPDAVRVEEMVNYFSYDYPGPTEPNVPFAADVALVDTPWNAHSQLMRIGIKGAEVPAAARTRANLVFLIDTSGSMNHPNKLPLLVNALRMMVEALDPDDTVAIVTYAGSAGLVLEATPASDKGRILDSLTRLSTGGSTAGGAGIRLAYDVARSGFDPDAVNRVVLATDGDFNVGMRDTEELKGFVARKRQTGIFLSVLGFGRGNLNDALMQALAQNGNGQAAYIDTLGEARKVLVEEMSGTLMAIAKDVKIQVEFNPAMVAEYRLIGYETRALRREDFNNDAVDAGEIGAGHRVTALYEVLPADAPAEARLLDDLRYGTAPAAPGSGDEIAFLQIRYKAPDGDRSRLIRRPITQADRRDLAGDQARDVRFAAAVAAFGQLLRGGRYTGDYGFDDVITLASGAKGPDPFGYRAEFVGLVRLAQALSPDTGNP